MSFTVPETFDGPRTNYEPVPPDNHVGVLIGITQLGTHMESYQGGPEKPVRKIRLQWELPDVTRQDGQTHTISAKYNYSLHEKSNFRKMLDAWLGAGWPEKFRGQSWEFLLCKPALVNVESREDSNDSSRVYSFVQNVTKLPKGMPAIEPTRSTFFLDLSQKHLPPELSLRDAELIRQSVEYKAGGFKDEAPRPNANGYGGNGNNAPRGQDPNLPPVDDAPFEDEDGPRF